MSELRKCGCGAIVGKEEECCEGARPDTASDARRPLQTLIDATSDDEAIRWFADAMQDAERGREAEEVVVPYHIAYRVFLLALDHPSRAEQNSTSPALPVQECLVALPTPTTCCSHHHGGRDKGGRVIPKPTPAKYLAWMRAGYKKLRKAPLCEPCARRFCEKRGLIFVPAERQEGER